MKRIRDEQARIDAYRFKLKGAHAPAAFFNSHENEDWEWVILSYLAEILSSVGLQSPEYAQKLKPPSPDFQTYLADKSPFRLIEVTEVIRPGYKRNLSHKRLAAEGITEYEPPRPRPQPWSGFRQVLQKKFSKRYPPDTCLLVYHNMAESEFHDSHPNWHERVLRELRKWTYDSPSSCDITRSRYHSILVIDCTGEAAVRLHPQWDIIQPSREV
jgi:hypothetical protein